MNYYAIEGLGGVGKTTLLKNLSPKYYSKFNEISTADKDAKSVKQFTDNKRKNKIANSWFLKRELNRINKFSKQKINILDRGIYSQLAYVYAKYKTYGHEDIFYLIKKLKKLEKDYSYKYPLLIYLDSSIKFSEENNQKTKSSRIYDPQFYKNIKFFYNVLYKLIGNKNALKIKIPLGRPTLYNKINNFISTTKKNNFNFSIIEIEKHLNL